MSNGNYWSRLLDERISRRRALAATGMASVGAAIALACGGSGGDSDSGGGQGESGLVSKRVDTTKQAKPGGIWQRSVNLDVQTWDVNVNTSSISISEYVPAYSLMTKYGIGADGHNPGAGAITGDAAASWELSGDAQQITFKLRDNHVFDPRPPTNGRAMDSADVKYSWERFAELNRFRGEIVNAVDPAGPIDSISTPDSKTVVFKLAYPYPAITEVFAFHTYLFVIPKEAEGGFDLKSTVRGSGPFFVDTIEPSVGWTFKKNPNWYEKGRPFLDGIKTTIITDYAAGLPQFEAKALWTYPVTQDDILRVKRDHPELVMLPNTTGGIPSTGFMSPSRKPGNPLLDARVRRAASMIIDRDLWIDTINGVEAFRNEGLPVETFWHTHMAYGGDTWVDPKGTGLGDAAKYFKHDPAEAKKLIQATGLPTPINTPMSVHTRGSQRTYEILAGMLQDSGMFTVPMIALDYNTEYRVAQQSRGFGFDGWYRNTNGGFNDDAWYVSMYTPNGKFSVSAEPIPGITDLVLKARAEVDSKKRADLMLQLQKDLANDMTAIMFPGESTEFTLRWPWFKNDGVFGWGGQGESSSSSRTYTQSWYDETLKT